MRGQFIKMNKEQFKQFNEDDQFGLIEDLFEDFEEYDFDNEMDKMFDKYDSICVDRDDNIWGEKEGNLSIIKRQVIESHMIAQGVVDF